VQFIAREAAAELGRAKPLFHQRDHLIDRTPPASSISVATGEITNHFPVPRGDLVARFTSRRKWEKVDSPRAPT
jgi:hypothetical protein